MLVPHVDFDAHVPRLHRVGEHHHLDLVPYRVAHEEPAAVDVLEVFVGFALFGDKHLEHAHHLVRVAAGLHDDA